MTPPPTSDRPDLLLVSCGMKTGPEPAPARDLYVSDLFREKRRYAEATGIPWFILSAEHGLVRPDEVLAPADRDLLDMSEADRTAWGHRVAEQFDATTGPLTGRRVEVHAPAPYVAAVADLLERKGALVLTPLVGMTRKQRRSWYWQRLDSW